LPYFLDVDGDHATEIVTESTDKLVAVSSDVPHAIRHPQRQSSTLAQAILAIRAFDPAVEVLNYFKIESIEKVLAIVKMAQLRRAPVPSQPRLQPATQQN
jgi:hypothetical protein